MMTTKKKKEKKRRRTWREQGRRKIGGVVVAREVEKGGFKEGQGTYILISLMALLDLWLIWPYYLNNGIFHYLLFSFFWFYDQLSIVVSHSLLFLLVIFLFFFLILFPLFLFPLLQYEI